MTHSRSDRTTWNRTVLSVVLPGWCGGLQEERFGQRWGASTAYEPGPGAHSTEDVLADGHDVGHAAELAEHTLAAQAGRLSLSGEDGKGA